MKIPRKEKKVNKQTRILKRYTPENEHDIGKCQFSLRNTSSNGGFSIVMLVFGWLSSLQQKSAEKTDPRVVKHKIITCCIEIFVHQHHQQQMPTNDWP